MENVVFRGSTNINLDEKGRLSIPSKYRASLGAESLVLTIDPEARCLLLYPQAKWQIIENKISALPSFNTVARKIQRLLLGHATELSLDAQGRILIAQNLREYAYLNKNVLLLGQGNKFELWDVDYWEKQRSIWLEEEVISKALLPEGLQELSL